MSAGAASEKWPVMLIAEHIVHKKFLNLGPLDRRKRPFQTLLFSTTWAI